MCVIDSIVTVGESRRSMYDAVPQPPPSPPWKSTYLVACRSKFKLNPQGSGRAAAASVEFALQFTLEPAVDEIERERV